MVVIGVTSTNKITRQQRRRPHRRS